MGKKDGNAENQDGKRGSASVLDVQSLFFY